MAETAAMEPRYDYRTLTEAARTLKISSRTLAKWARDGKIPALKTPGGHWRFHPDDLILAFTPARAILRESEGGEE